MSIVFDDGKEPDALRTIGEVTAALGIRQHVLRYWEEQFPTLSPIKRSGGRRYYRPEDVALVAEIDRLVHKEGYTLRGARQAIEGGKAVRGGAAGKADPAPGHAAQASAPASPQMPANPGARASSPSLDQLKTLRDGLARALSAD